MEQTQQVETYQIDASDKRMGRIATEAASVLMGKTTTAYKRNQHGAVSVVISNASKMDLPERKLSQKEYLRYSGYPGGQKSERLEEVIEKKGASEALRRAVYGMLPSNRLRARMMSQLIIEE